MNPLTQFKKTTILSIIIVAKLGCFGISPTAQAVVPPPDGGYPGGNTAEGQAALASLTAGTFNTAIGFASLRSITAGQFCTAVGAGTLLANTGDGNTATGTGALSSNADGINNTANGAFALFSDTQGGFNTANGYLALFSNNGGNDNTASGFQALFSNTLGGGNTAMGEFALFSNTEGGFNTAIGEDALVNLTTGTGNIALGAEAGANLTTGDSNIDIGNLGVAGESNTIRIGDVGVQGATFIAGISGQNATGGDAVFVTSTGKLGTITAPSSARFKNDIKPMEKASEVILALKPVTFRYKKDIDAKGIPQFGLVAEEVEKVNPDLVKRDRDGKLQTVRYDAVNTMLLNEFLKEHRKVESLEKAMAEQQKENAAMRAMLKEQAAQIQKVSAQLELSKAAPQTVVNNQ